MVFFLLVIGELELIVEDALNLWELIKSLDINISNDYPLFSCYENVP